MNASALVTVYTNNRFYIGANVQWQSSKQHYQTSCYDTAWSTGFMWTRQISPVSQRGSEQAHVYGKWSLIVVGTALRNQGYQSTWGHMSRNDVYTLSVSTIYIVNMLGLFLFFVLTAIDFSEYWPQQTIVLDYGKA